MILNQVAKSVVHITDKSGLILEGGGMRGVFTCGVLDYFIELNRS